MEACFVVIGGGIAGVTCAENLSLLEPEKTVILLSESSLIKSVTNLHAITKVLTEFDIKEIECKKFSSEHPNVTIVHSTLTEINDEERYIVTRDNKVIKYQYLCICTGAEPKLIPQSSTFPQIIGIRDTDSVDQFLNKMQDAKKVVIVGNGGIASELVYKMRNVEIHWVIKDKYITATFVDPGAAEFFQSSLNKNDEFEEPVSKRMRYVEDNFIKTGAALGPDWYKNIIISGAGNQKVSVAAVNIHYESEVLSIRELTDCQFSLEVLLTTEEKIECDLVISATGVTPRKCFKIKNELEVSEDGGIQVNEFMKTNLPFIYAAGDVCSANWPLAKHWFQMKLWTQARQMGCYAAKCMVGHLNNEEILQDFCFEMFAHSTKLFGYKVILLGLYNGQKLGNDYEILIRMTKGHEFIKFVLENNKLQGAVLIGETDLEEMAENLILNQIDLSPYGDDILNPKGNDI
nr:pyridine nucleotide-disulfide oxidoreductase domain-containing protein 1 [Leptinotarsa decemlineata]